MDNDKKEPNNNEPVILDTSGSTSDMTLESLAQIFHVKEVTPLNVISAIHDSLHDNRDIIAHELPHDVNASSMEVTGGTDISKAIKAVSKMRAEHFSNTTDNKNKPE